MPKIFLECLYMTVYWTILLLSEILSNKRYNGSPWYPFQLYPKRKCELANLQSLKCTLPTLDFSDKPSDFSCLSFWCTFFQKKVKIVMNIHWMTRYLNFETIFCLVPLMEEKKMSGKLCCKETACKTCGYLKVSVKWKLGRKKRLSSVNSSRCEQGSPRMAMAVRGDHGMEEVMLN